MGLTPGLAQWVKDPLLLWLWCRPASAALILPLVWELPYAMGTAPKGEKNVYVRAQNQDGRVVRCGTQLFPLYIKNTSAHGTVFTEHLLNTSGRPQTRTRKISMGREKGKKKKKEEAGRGPPTWEGAEGEESFLHPGKPHHQWGDQPRQKRSFRGSEERTTTGLWQAGNSLHRHSMRPPCILQPETPLC